MPYLKLNSVENYVQANQPFPALLSPFDTEFLFLVRVEVVCFALQIAVQGKSAAWSQSCQC